jgi:hypothetical protein
MFHGILNALIGAVLLGAFVIDPDNAPFPRADPDFEGLYDAVDLLLKTKDWNPWGANVNSTKVINPILVDWKNIDPGFSTDYQSILGSLGTGDLVYGLFNKIDDAFLSMADSVANLPFDNKLGLMMSYFVGGLPAMAPVDDYIAHHVDDYNIDDDDLYQLPWLTYAKDGIDNCDEESSIQLGSTTRYGVPLKSAEAEKVFVYADVSVEGLVVTIEIEYQDGQLDPRDVVRGKSVDDSDELKDWEMIVTFGETGGPNCVFKRGDTIFWQAGSVDQIPGYEITILLGASAISVLALVYVIMKKRKR